MNDYDQGWWRGLSFAMILMGILLMLVLWMLGIL